jgi:hypothetical protein
MPDCGLYPQKGACRRQPINDVSLYPSPFLSENQLKHFKKFEFRFLLARTWYKQGLPYTGCIRLI